MGKLFLALYKFIASDVVFRVLASLGLWVGVSSFISSIIDGYINKLLATFRAGSIMGDILAFANIAKLDDCLSICIGALLFVASYKSAKVIISRKS